MNASAASEAAARHLFEQITALEPDSIEWLSVAAAGRTARVTSGGEQFFVKWSGNVTGALALEAEADGLRRLHAVCPRHVVRLIGYVSAEDEAGSLLVLDHIDRTPRASTGDRRRDQGNSAQRVQDFDTALANALAEIHSATSDLYGLDRDNFIGATPQTNAQRTTWPTFFADQRLQAMAERLRSRNRWPAHWSSPFDRLLQRLPDVLPERPAASLLHGDLWSGNVMSGSGGQPILIDPAVYHGHAETDLAMMQLFGGFGSVVFEAYDHVADIQSGFEERVAIYNLYHLLNHVLLFGAGYHAGVEKTLARF